MSKDDLQSGHILVVDDSMTSRTLSRLYLEEAGYTVLEAESAGQALAMIAEQPPDVILLDVILPDLDGFEITRRLRDDPLLSSIPIVLVTALGDVESKIRGLEAGANDFLSKPPDEAELMARVHTLLRLKRNQEELLAEKAKIELLYRVSRELSAELEIEALLSRILELTVESSAACGGHIVLFDERGEGLYHISTYQKHMPPVAESVWIKVTRDGLAGWVVQNRQGTLVQDTQEDERWLLVQDADTSTRSAVATPLIYAGQVSGVLTLTHELPGHFTAAHLELLNSIASQGSVVIEKARVYQKEQARARQLQLINDVSRQVASILNPGMLLKEVSHLICQAFDYYYVEVALCDGDKLVFPGWGSGREEGLKVAPFHLDISEEGLTSWVARHGRPLFATDVSQEARYRPMAKLPDTVSELVVPLQAGGEILGVLDVHSDQTRQLTQEAVPLLETLASQISTALKNAYLFQERGQRITELATLNEVSQAISSVLDLDKLLDTVYQQVSRILDTTNFFIAVCGEEGEAWLATLHVEGGQRQATAPYSTTSGLTGYIIRNRSQVRLHSPEEAATFYKWQGIEAPSQQAKSWMGVPLVAAEQVVGVMTIHHRERESMYGEQEIVLFSTIAAQVSIAIANARLYTQTEQERGKMAAVLIGTDDVVIVTDESDKILLINPAAEDAFGIRVERAVGRPLAKVVPSQALVDLFRSGNDRPSSAAEISLNDERVFYANVSAVEGVGHVAVIQDITALKELEQMRLRAERAEREHLHQTLESYIGPDLVEKVLAEGGELLERRERVEAVILFADIRGFTRAAAVLSPEATVEVLNEFFTAMAGIIYHHEGTVVDLIGDELMASFGAPLARPDPEQCAVNAAIAFQEEFAHLRRKWAGDWGISVGLGVGVDRGQAVMGNVGTAERVSFTFIGNVVNRAHRLVEQAGPGEVQISGDILAKISTGQEAWEEVFDILAGGPKQAFRLQVLAEPGA
ncbi:MAG: GAF domain-containing protein [Thermoflexales bacterium]|nr:GAF domain-containing protein [Thermoflexales bacterium]